VSDLDLQIDVKPLRDGESFHNKADSLVLQIAQQDGGIDALDRRDFVAGIAPDKVARSLALAGNYLKVRLNPTVTSGDVDLAADIYVAETKKLGLPPQYRADNLPVMQRNPFYPPGILRGTVSGSYLIGVGVAENRLNETDLDWRFKYRQGFAFDLLWPVDAIIEAARRFPYLYWGARTMVNWSDGSVTHDGTRMGDVDFFATAVTFEGAIRYPLKRWLELRGAVNYGYQFGHFKFNQNSEGDAALGVPCHLEDDAIFTDPDKVTAAFDCTATRTAGAYDARPISAAAGLRLFFANLDFVWWRENLKADSDLRAPDVVNNYFLSLGVNFY